MEAIEEGISFVYILYPYKSLAISKLETVTRETSFDPKLNVNNNHVYVEKRQVIQFPVHYHFFILSFYRTFFDTICMKIIQVKNSSA